MPRPHYDERQSHSRQSATLQRLLPNFSDSSDEDFNSPVSSKGKTRENIKQRKRLVRFNDDDYVQPSNQDIFSPSGISLRETAPLEFFEIENCDLNPHDQSREGDNHKDSMQSMSLESPVTSPLIQLIPQSQSVDCAENLNQSAEKNEQQDFRHISKQNIMGQYEFVQPVDESIPPPADVVLEGTRDSSTNTLGLSIVTTRDPLTMGKHNLLHFISADCALKTHVSLTLSDLDLVDDGRLRECKPKKGQVIVSRVGRVIIFNAVIKERYFDRPTKEELYQVIASLPIAMERNQVNSLRVSTVGDGLNKLSSNLLRNTLRSIFAGCNVTFTLCTGEVQTPPAAQRKQIIHEYHSSLTGGHKGITKTYKNIRNRFLWPEMKNDIQNFVRRCRSCQEQKLVRIKTRQPMIITDTPADAFDKVAIDLVGPLPITPDGNKYVLTMQDNLTKYCMAEEIPDKRATTVADVFARQLIGRFGCPRAILSDRGGEFVNNLLRNLASIYRLKHLTTSGYHP